MRKTIAALALGALAALVAIAVTPTAARAQQAVTGKLGVIWEDPSDPRLPVKAHYLVWDNVAQRNVEVHIDSLIVAAQGGNKKIIGRNFRFALQGTVRNVTQMNAVAALSDSVGPINGKPGYLSPTGTYKFIVLPCGFPGGPTPDPTVLNTLWTTSVRSVSKYWTETSGGQFNVSGTVDPVWKTMPQSYAQYIAAQDTLIAQRMLEDCMALHTGIDYSQYQGVNMEMNQDLGASTGGALTFKVNGTPRAMAEVTTYLYGAFSLLVPGVMSHEVGHTFGLQHSSPQIAAVYGSPWDVMSNASYGTESNEQFGAQTLAAQKDYAGWIPANRIFTATGASSTITIERNANPGSNSNYLIAKVPITSFTTDDRYYTVELRQKSGFDRIIPLEGVVIHEYATAARAEPFQLVDRDGNGVSTDSGTVLVAGQTFDDRARQVSITVESIGASSAVVTIRNGPTVSFSISAKGAKHSVVAGSASKADSISVAVGGAYATSTAWTAFKAPAAFFSRGNWLKIDTPVGTGSGYLKFHRDPTGLAAGTYIDTIQVSTTALSGVPKMFIDTLIATSPAQLYLGLSVQSVLDSAVAPAVAQDTVIVNITGPGAATAQWTASKKKGNTVLIGAGTNTITGTGPGSFHFGSTALTTTVPGMVIDTITVTLNANPAIFATIIDTSKFMEITQYTLSSRGRKLTMAQGADPIDDSVSVGLNGSWATVGNYTLSMVSVKPTSFAYPVAHNMPPQFNTFPPLWYGTGSSYAHIQWKVTNKTAPGTYIDSIWVRGPNPQLFAGIPTHEGPQLIIDTLVVTPGNMRVTLSKKSSLDSASAGMTVSRDSVFVQVVGFGGDSAIWQPAATVNFTDPLVFAQRYGFYGPGAGMGSGWAVYFRNTDKMHPGLNVNSFSWQVQGQPSVTATLVDSFYYLPATAVTASTKARKVQVTPGSTTAVTDTANVYVLGTNASATAWTATKKRNYTTLTTAAGTGSGVVKWSRNPTGLAAGVYVDTISIASTGLIGASIIDTLTVGTAASTSAPATPQAKVTVEGTGGVIGMDVSALLTLDLSSTSFALQQFAAIITFNAAVLKFDSVSSTGTGLRTTTASPVISSNFTVAGSDPVGKGGSLDLARLWFHIVVDQAGQTSQIAANFTTATASGTPATNLLPLFTTTNGSTTTLSGALRGDVNLDGKLTTADALAILNSVAGNAPAAGIRITPNADANCNGKVEAVDALVILSKLLGLPVTQFCVGTVR